MIDGLKQTAAEWMARAAEVADLVLEIGRFFIQVLPALLGAA